MEKEMMKEVAKDEIRPLSKIIRDFCRSLKNKKKIIRHENTYITLKGDESNTMYCSRCWDKDKDLIQMDKLNNGRILCPNCKQICCYDRNIYNESNAIRKTSVNSVANRRRKV